MKGQRTEIRDGGEGEGARCTEEVRWSWDEGTVMVAGGMACHGHSAIAENRSEWRSRSRTYSKPMPPSYNWSYGLRGSWWEWE